MANIKSIGGNPIVVQTTGIEDLAVTTAKLADDAVTGDKLAVPYWKWVEDGDDRRLAIHVEEEE